MIMSKCKFDRGWIGKCNNEVVKGTDYCSEHLDINCVSCGKQATHDCPETFQFVCGAPLCDNCIHDFRDKTTGCYSHCKKVDLQE
jgi:hypothetical protein